MAAPKNKIGNSIDAYIGRRLQARRETMALSLEEVSTAVGISPARLKDFEKGTLRVGNPLLYDLSEALDVDPSYFFDGINSKNIVPISPTSWDDDPNTLSMMRVYNKITHPNLKKNLLKFVEFIVQDQQEAYLRLVPGGKKIFDS